MTRRTFDGLVAWLVYVAGLIATTLGLYGLVVHGERVAYIAWLAVGAGLAACVWARHTFKVMSHIDQLQAHIRARLNQDLDPDRRHQQIHDRLDEPLDRVLMDLVLEGVFEFDGIDPDGTFLYRLTPRGRQEHGQ